MAAAVLVAAVMVVARVVVVVGCPPQRRATRLRRPQRKGVGLPASSPQRGPSLTPARPAPSLEALARQRYRLNPDVPGSLREGLEETIIINRLGVTDGIPAIDRPRFHRIADADFLTEREPVLVLQLGDDARAYPLLILVWHEIVNDTVDGVPVAVTYCPLCNSAFA